MFSQEPGGWASALAHSRFELMPIRGGLDAAASLPPGATVSVTCSPAVGLDKSLDFAVALARRDLRVVAHVAARRVRDRDHLTRILDRLDAGGIRDVFVVAGDHTDHPGEFASGLALIEAIRAMDAPLRSIGVPAYPEGHPTISDHALDEALISKSGLADYMVSQLCFDTARIERWLHGVRDHGIGLPLYLGVPGVLERRRLLGIGMRIGLGDSLRFLRNHGNLAGGLLSPSRYTPFNLLSALDDAFEDPYLNIAGVHFNTFNQVEETVKWSQGFVREGRRLGETQSNQTAVHTTR